MLDGIARTSLCVDSIRVSDYHLSRRFPGFPFRWLSGGYRGRPLVAIAKLSKRIVDQLEPGPKPYFVYDEELTGFGVRVGPSGAKSWFIEYRPGAGGRNAPKRRVTLGPTSKFMPDQARRQAQDDLARVRLGSDPSAARRAERTAYSLAEIADRYLEEEVRAIGPRHRHPLRALHREAHQAGPRPTQRKFNHSSRPDRLHREIGATRKVTANRVMATLSGLFNYGSKVGVLPEGFNPAKGMTAFKEEARERYLTMDELQRLGEALRKAETTGLPWDVDETKLAPSTRLRPRSGSTSSRLSRPPRYGCCSSRGAGCGDPAPAVGGYRLRTRHAVPANVKDGAEDRGLERASIGHPERAASSIGLRHHGAGTFKAPR